MQFGGFPTLPEGIRTRLRLMPDGDLRFCARCIRPTAVYVPGDGREPGTYLCGFHYRRERLS